MRVLLRGAETDGLSASLRAELTTEWSVDEWRPGESREAEAKLLAEADAMVSMRWSADWPPAPRLKLLQLPGAGYDGVAFEALPPGALVCNVFEHEIGIAEYVLAAMLEWRIGLRRLDAQIRRGDWSGTFSHPDGPRLHGELYGATLGLIGYGHIGRAVAERAAAFGMIVRACTRRPETAADDPLLERVDGMHRLDALLAQSDFVVVACPLTDETRGLIAGRELASMRDDGVLVNVARGPVVDERALYDALREQRIGGAVVDVWYRYPSGDAAGCLPSALPFHELDNIIMSPHASGLSAGLLQRRWSRIARNLDAVARGEMPDNVLRAPSGATSG